MDERERARQVKRVNAGSVDALQRLIIHYDPPLRRAIDAKIAAKLRRYLDVDDVLQEAYVAAFKNLPEPHFDGPGGFYKWLERIALNELKNQRRALNRQKRDIGREVAGRTDPGTSYPDLVQRLAGTESTPSRLVAQDEAVAAVMSSLARLTDDQRAVIRLRFLAGKSVANTAAELGKTEQAIHALCYRALKELRRHLVSATKYLTGS